MKKKHNVYLMYAIIFLQGLVFYGPIATLYRQNRGISLSQIFLIESISWILMIIFEVPWGWFADRFGYKRTLVISNLAYFASKIVFFRANSFVMFFVERILLSLSLAGLSGCDEALIYLSIDESESEKVFGRYSAFGNAGYLLASLISSLLVSISMDSTAFGTMIPYGIAVILTLFIKDVNVEVKEKPKFKESFFRVLKNKGIIALVVSSALITEVVQTVSTFLNQSQYLRCGIGIAAFGILTTVMQIVKLSSLKAGKLKEKIGSVKCIGCMYIIIALCCGILVFTSNAILSILSIAAICASSSIILPIIMSIENKSIKSGDRATILSIFSIFGDFTSAGVNVFIGKIADISIELTFGLCIGLCILAYVLLFVYKQMKNNNYIENDKPKEVA